MLVETDKTLWKLMLHADQGPRFNRIFHGRFLLRAHEKHINLLQVCSSDDGSRHSLQEFPHIVEVVGQRRKGKIKPGDSGLLFSLPSHSLLEKHSLKVPCQTSWNSQFTLGSSMYFTTTSWQLRTECRAAGSYLLKLAQDTVFLAGWRGLLLQPTRNTVWRYIPSVLYGWKCHWEKVVQVRRLFLLITQNVDGEQEFSMTWTSPIFTGQT